MLMETKQGKRGRIRKWASMKLNILCMSDVEFRLLQVRKNVHVKHCQRELLPLVPFFC